MNERKAIDNSITNDVRATKTYELNFDGEGYYGADGFETEAETAAEALSDILTVSGNDLDFCVDEITVAEIDPDTMATVNRNEISVPGFDYDHGMIIPANNANIDRYAPLFGLEHFGTWCCQREGFEGETDSFCGTYEECKEYAREYNAEEYNTEKINTLALWEINPNDGTANICEAEETIE